MIILDNHYTLHYIYYICMSPGDSDRVFCKMNKSILSCDYCRLLDIGSKCLHLTTAQQLHNSYFMG